MQLATVLQGKRARGLRIIRCTLSTVRSPLSAVVGRFHRPRAENFQTAISLRSCCKFDKKGGEEEARYSEHKSQVCPSTNYGKSKMHIRRALREMGTDDCRLCEIKNGIQKL